MHPLSEVGPWARQKLDVLAKYLRAYTTVLKGERWCEGYIYVDAFAGPGTHSLRPSDGVSARDSQLRLIKDEPRTENFDDQQFIDGSPRVALSLVNPFTHYRFIELNPARAARLRELKTEYPNRDIVVWEKDCNSYLIQNLLARPKTFWTSHRAVVFLDPFGMQVPWSTLESLGSTNAIEVLINLPVGMAIQRLLRRDGRFSITQREKLDAYLGSSEWFDVIYESDETLFGVDMKKVEWSGEKLVDWYRKRLAESSFKFVSVPRLVRNTHGGHLYYLIHAGPNATGNKIANQILIKGMQDAV